MATSSATSADRLMSATQCANATAAIAQKTGNGARRRHNSGATSAIVNSRASAPDAPASLTARMTSTSSRSAASG
jgi:hypothetical protein